MHVRITSAMEAQATPTNTGWGDQSWTNINFSGLFRSISNVEAYGSLDKDLLVYDGLLAKHLFNEPAILFGDH
jgi:hypothetical protein